MNRLVLLLVGLALVVLLVFINQGMNRTAHREGEEAPPPAKTAAEAAPTPAESSGPVDLPPEIIVNDPAKAKHKILLGWEYNAESQASPQKLSQAVQAIKSIAQNSGGRVSAVIVNVDVPPDERSVPARAISTSGIIFDGQPRSGIVGEGDLSAESLRSFLEPALSH